MSSLKENIVAPNVSESKKPIGRYTVELFDETGRKVAQSRQDNYVHPALYEAHTLLYPFSPLGLGVSGYGGASEPYNGLILTDASNPPNSIIDRYVEGNVIGIGIRGQTGGNIPKKGSYNAGESITNKGDYQKFVFDFATNEANGTFQSVYMADVDMGSTSSSTFNSYGIIPAYSAKSVMSATLNPPFERFSDRAKVFGEYLYYWTGSSLTRMELFESAGNKFGAMKFSDMKNTSYVLPFNITSMTVKGDTIYFLEGNNKVHTAPVSNPVNTSLKHTFTSTNLGYGVASVLGIAYKWDSDTFIIGSNVGLAELRTNDFSVLRHYTSDPNHFSVRGWSGMEISKFNPDNIILEKRVFSLTRGLVIWETSQNFRTGITEYSPLYSIYTGGNGGYDSWLIPSPQFFSKAVLDSPVTKTSQQTMKITYELTIPKFSMSIGFKGYGQNV